MSASPYYTRIERGDINGVSDGVLEALARALQLDEAEHAHLFDLARALGPAELRDDVAERRKPSVGRASNDASTRSPAPPRSYTTPAWTTSPPTSSATPSTPTCSRRPPARPVNSARYVFLDPRARDFYIDWDRAASDVVAILRSAAGRDPHDRDLSDLVGELSTQSDEFRTRWAAHNVRFHDTGTKEFHHPVVGDITTTYNRMDLAADPGLTITIYTAEPGSKPAEALNLLGSWAATPGQPEPQNTDPRP